MSLSDLTVDELKQVADEFVLNVDVENEDALRSAVESLNPSEVALSFPQLTERIIEEPEPEEEDDTALVTSDATPRKTSKKVAAKKAVAKKATASKTVVPDDRTLLKMTRNNPVYEIRGYRFTRQMPYVFVKTSDVDFLIEVEGGFTVAKPSEVESFFS